MVDSSSLLFSSLLFFLWEDLKAYIQQYCVAEQKRLRQQRQQDRRQLVQQLRTARRLQHMFPIPATTAGLLAAKRALQLHEQAQAASRARCQEVVHDVYGEASTYYFHRLGKPPPESQLITEVANPAHPGSTVSLSAPGGTQQAATIFADYYDAATGGLFTVHPTTAADQQLLLAAVDSQLSPEEQRQCLGALPDGSIQEDEAEAALRSLPRGKAPGSDGLTYEFHAALWSEVDDWMIAAFNQPYFFFFWNVSFTGQLDTRPKALKKDGRHGNLPKPCPGGTAKSTAGHNPHHFATMCKHIGTSGCARPGSKCGPM
eukprot:gene6285-biopygen8100